MIDITNLLFGVGSLLTGVGALASFRKNRDNGKKLDESKTQVEEVHLAVNSNLERVVARLRQLTKVLQDNNIEVPPEGRHDGTNGKAA